MVSPNPPSNAHPQAFKGGKMLVISPNYSLSLHPTTLERNHLRHSTSRYKKKKIPFIWCNFSSLSVGKKASRPFSITSYHLSIRQAVTWTGNFPLQPAVSPIVHSRPVCRFPLFYGEDLSVRFFLRPRGPPESCGKVFSGCFYSPIRL